ncbi:SagB family peptide dehydrogenase [Sphaerisporangium sp. NPDC051017]|uniref:SagB family peptide dehydrogenase n=1 Tax=Sphaerisporangium sp. NPDC051017 TaxID=3154636 RepID=UPI00343EBEF2
MSEQSITLPDPRKNLNSSVHEVLSNDESPDRPSILMSLDDLSTFLWFAFGQVGIKKTPASGNQIRKASPSGGSRHPTEAYLLALESGDLPSGVYHYSVRDHALEFITTDIDREWTARYVVEKPEWMDIAPTMAIILTSCVERSMFRYRENYSYRPIHHDVGHVLETASLTATALGYKYFRGFSVNDREVSAKLRIPRLTQPTMAFMLLG